MSSIPKTTAPHSGSFINLQLITDWQELETQAVIFGVPYGKPYAASAFPNNQSTAPTALRKASSRIVIDTDAIEADGDPSAPLAAITIADGGDIPLFADDVEQHYIAAEQAVRFAISKGILPVSIGGDDGITNPVVRGLDGLSDVTLIQIDAHLDWRDERYGEKDGYSSPMRRASELPHITAIHQIGIRSFGSSRQEDIDDARNWGAHIHPARDICTHGIQQVIDSLPNGGRFFVSLDVDGLDPSVMPGTIALAPGGLSWWHIIELFEGLARKGDIVGLNVVELAPENDVNQISLIGVGRLILKLLMLQLEKSESSS